MIKTLNQTHIEGYIYEHDLELKVSGPNSKTPGTEFISGTISIATDDALQNIVPVHYTYVTATTSKGGANANFTLLKNVVDGVLGTVMKDGKDNAAKVSIDSNIGLNEFYSDRNGKEELISAKRNEGGFVRKIDVINEDEKLRNTFKCDMIITGTRRIDADPEKNLPEKLIIKGCIFDFRNAILPVEFSALNPHAMDYFEGLEPSSTNPVFTRVWGRQISETIVRQLVEESAFGEDAVREVKNTRKDFVVTGAAKEPYEWNTEDTITVEELTKAMADREVALAAMKQRQDEYKASQKQTATAAPAAGGFNF